MNNFEYMKYLKNAKLKLRQDNLKFKKDGYKKPKFKKIFSNKKWAKHNNKNIVQPLPFNPLFPNANATDTNNANDISEIKKLKRKRNNLSR